MHSESTLFELLDRSRIEIVDSSIEEQVCEDMIYLNFAFDLLCELEDKTFVWTIKKTYYEFQNLRQRLLNYLKLKEIGVLQLPSLTQFLKRSVEHQLSVLQQYLQYFLEHPTYFREPILTEFIEVSYNSFVYQQKYKEGYVQKIGSGRAANRRKYCKCYNFVQRNHRKWLRVTEHGLVYSTKHFVHDVAEVINFSSVFRVAKGKKHTGFTDGIKVVNNIHTVTFRTGNTKQRDEFEHSILRAFSQSGYQGQQARYDATFMPRCGNVCKWYVDSQQYFGDVYKALSGAKRYVFITDWWMSPELYLQRPASQHPDSQLVEVLGKLADRGVAVYVHVYKEIRFSLSINSCHTKRSLLHRSRNIHVLRHPNISLAGGVFLWSHHEKMLVVDGEIGFLGGLDLCYGRYDTPAHSLVDTTEPYIWNHLDYSNVRIADFVQVNKWNRESIERTKVPRLPWHDIAISVAGEAVLDMEHHFRDLWNHAVRDITGSRDSKVIVPPQNRANPDTYMKSIRALLFRKNSVTSSKRESITSQEPVSPLVRPAQATSRSFNIGALPTYINLKRLEEKFEEQLYECSDTCEIIDTRKSKSFSGIQEFRSVCDLLNPQPHLRVARPSEEFIESSLQEKQAEEELETNDTKNTLIQAYSDGEPVFLPNAEAVHTTFTGTVDCQLLRSVGLWSVGRQVTEYSIHNAYLWQIAQAKQFIYIENQFFISGTAGRPCANQIAEALKRRILTAYSQNAPFKVIVVLPLLPGFEGSVDDPGASVLRVQLHYQYRTICRGPTSLYESLKSSGVNPRDYIRFYGLRTHAVLSDTPVTEMIYVHSKLMIVDDRVVILGSANINDRSLVGSRDSELAMVVEDASPVDLQMGQVPFTGSEFAHSLRMELFKEHTGETKGEALLDPFSEEFSAVWERRAQRNTEFYREVFGCYPDDGIQRLNQTEELMKKANLERYREEAENVVGHLVEFPLQFLAGENLRLKIANREYFLPDITFT